MTGGISCLKADENRTRNHNNVVRSSLLDILIHIPFFDELYFVRYEALTDLSQLQVSQMQNLAIISMNSDTL